MYIQFVMSVVLIFVVLYQKFIFFQIDFPLKFLYTKFWLWNFVYVKFYFNIVKKKQSNYFCLKTIKTQK